MHERKHPVGGRLTSCGDSNIFVPRLLISSKCDTHDQVSGNRVADDVRPGHRDRFLADVTVARNRTQAGIPETPPTDVEMGNVPTKAPNIAFGGPLLERLP